MDNTKFISEVIEKMVDSQISNTQALTSLKESINHTYEKLQRIEGFFNNGFRTNISYIKVNVDEAIKKIEEINKSIASIEKNQSIEVLSEKLEQLNRKVEDNQQALKESIESYKKTSFWVKPIVGLITAFCAVIASIMGILKLWQG